MLALEVRMPLAPNAQSDRRPPPPQESVAYAARRPMVKYQYDEAPRTTRNPAVYDKVFLSRPE